MMEERINYIHNKPVKHRYVDDGVHWQYSRTRDYDGICGLIEVEKFFLMYMNELPKIGVKDDIR